ncbi:MAG: hypothetical protein K6T16_01565 [Candidatus Pacearchaeota archaeon]|nr:hypothetical protein [Candidatus Pacearchaeota archaeon]
MRKIKSNPRRPPKKWFKKMVERVKKYDGRKYGFTPEQTVGGIWYKKLTPAKRREILKRYERRIKRKAKSNPKPKQIKLTELNKGMPRAEDPTVKFKNNSPEPDWSRPPTLLGFIKKGKKFGVLYEDRTGRRYYHFFKKIPKLMRTKDGRLAFVDGIRVYRRGGISG